MKIIWSINFFIYYKIGHVGWKGTLFCVTREKVSSISLNHEIIFLERWNFKDVYSGGEYPLLCWNKYNFLIKPNDTEGRVGTFDKCCLQRSSQYIRHKIVGYKKHNST